MAKKSKQPTSKSSRKSLLKEVETKLAETLKGYFKKVSDKKLEKQIRKASKMFVESVTNKEPIKVVHKEKVKTAKKTKKPAEKEIAS